MKKSIITTVTIAAAVLAANTAQAEEVQTPTPQMSHAVVEAPTDQTQQPATETTQGTSAVEAAKEGYVEAEVSQGLVYDQASEPNAKVEIQYGQEVTEAEVQEVAKNSDVGDKDYLVNTVLDTNSEFIDDGKYVKMEAGKTTTAIYTGLENSSYNGKAIKGVRYELTPDQDVYAILYNDPTISVGLMNMNKPVNVKAVVSFYDNKYRKIELTERALFGFNSLNNGMGEKGQALEYVKNYGDYIEINGSTIKLQEDGKAYAPEINDENVIGAWDDYKNDNFYKGSIVGRTVNGQMEFEFGNDGRVWQWFALNSFIPVKNVPTQVVPGDFPTVDKPEITVEYKIPEDFPTVKIPRLDITMPKPPVMKTDKPSATVKLSNPKTFGGTVKTDAVKATPKSSYAVKELPKTGEKSDTILSWIGTGLISFVTLMLGWYMGSYSELKNKGDKGSAE